MIEISTLLAIFSISAQDVALLREASHFSERRTSLVGYDNIPSIKQYFKTNQLFATVDQFPSLQAITSIELALEALDKSMKQEELPNVLKTKTGVVLK